MITVDQSGNADVTTIQEALNKVEHLNEKDRVIIIKKGTYQEKLSITMDNVTLIGESPEDTQIVYGDYAKMQFEDGTFYRTFNTATVFVEGKNVTLKNLMIKNNAGEGEKVGQAVALYVEGDGCNVIGCRILGHQDTLFTGPLPHKPIEGNDFGGPMEGKERIIGKHFFQDCYIEGTIDFIFGSARAVFYHCDIFSIDRKQPINGYVTAASTYQGEKYGYVFLDCRLASNCEKETVYLGRPWRDYAKTVFIRCYLGDHIKKEGWHDWNKSNARENAFYAEYDCYGPGATLDERVDFAHVLTEEEAAEYTLNNILER